MDVLASTLIRNTEQVQAFLLIGRISVRPCAFLPTAIPPLAVIQAAPASQAGSGWVSRQRKGPQGRIQVL